MSQDDGGSAFPCLVQELLIDHPMAEQPEPRFHGGMSMRDYFAAKFAHAEMVTSGALPEPARALVEGAKKAGRTIEQQVAYNAYLLADAMLAERKKP